MMMNGFLFIGSVVALLHAAVLSVVFGPWHWKYLLVAVVSGVALWGFLPVLLPLRRWRGLMLGAVLALSMQQAAFWLWRAKLGGVGWPLVQFASVHLLIGLVFARMRLRRPSTFVRRGTTIKPVR